MPDANVMMEEEINALIVLVLLVTVERTEALGDFVKVANAIEGFEFGGREV